MIRNVITQSKNHFANFEDLPEYSDKHIEEQISVDTEVPMLSSRKLWQILKLNQIKGCELDKDFVQHIKNELIARNDFDNGKFWNEPH